MYKLLIFLFFINLINTNAQIIGGKNEDKAYDMITDGNGKLYLVGSTTSYGNGNRDAFVIKYDYVNQNYTYTTWGKTDYDEYRSIDKINDGFLISGFSFWASSRSTDPILSKLNSNFEIEWTKNFGFGGYEFGYKTSVLKSGNFLLGGLVTDNGCNLYGPYLIKLNTLGDTIWQKIYPKYTPGYLVDFYEKENNNIVLLCSKGGFFNLGGIWHASFISNSNIYLVEVDSSGNYLKDKEIVAKHHDTPVKILPKLDGHFYMLSHSQSYSQGKNFDICLSLVDENFNVEWTKTYGGDKFEYAADMAIDELGNIHIVGTSASQNEDYPVIMYIKTDSLGVELETDYLMPESRGYGNSIEIIDSSVFLLGTTSINGNDDFVLFINKELNNHESKFENEIVFFPNPVLDVCKVHLKQSEYKNQKVKVDIFDMKGAKVISREEQLYFGDYSFSLDLSNLMRGQYIVKISNVDNEKILNALIIKQ